MVGITSEKVQSQGCIQANLHINNWDIPANLHIVDKNFPIASDGILGQDFLKFYKSKIDYENNTLLIKFGYGKTTINLHNFKNLNIVTVPARSEILIDLPIKLSEDSVIFNDEIASGIFVASSILNKSTPVLKLLNINHVPVTINTTNFKLEPLSNYEIKQKSPVQNLEIDNKRSSKVMQLLFENNSNLSPEIQKKLEHVLKNYSDVFALDTDKLSTNNFYTQKLKLSDNTPIYVKNYRLPESQKSELNSQIEKLIENEIIEPSTSDYSSPIFLVPKKSDKSEKKWRLVVDFRKLNKKLIGDVFPIPRIDDILDQLGRAKYFSVLDLQSGFHQIKLDENSRDYTSFQTDKGSYRFTRVPFGIKIAPNSFARMMSLAFSGLTPEKAFLYMDDLIVIGCSKNHHISNLISVFENCRKFNLKLNPKKCNLFRHEVTYLGHKCTDKGVSVDDSKISSIQKYPIPKDANETRRFVAFANYYRKFIKNFAEITQPLNKLTRKNINFIWSEECQKAFDKIKNALTKPPILVYPNFKKEFIIITDASKIGVGGTLCQNYNGILKPISYFSKSFTKGESNKSTIEQELLGIYFSIMHFRPYVFGRKFRVKTDHKPLVYLFSLKNPSSRLTRIRLELEEYNFEVEHIPGKNNYISDALSRITIKDLIINKKQNSNIYAITRSMTKQNSSMNNNMKQSSKNNQNNKPTVIFTNDNLSHFNKVKFFSLIDNNKVKMLLKFKNNKKICIYEYDLIRDKIFDLDQMLNQLNNILEIQNVDEIKIYDNDYIFHNIELSKFKNAANTILKNKCIIITRAQKVITNEKEIDKIIKIYHDDPISGGHCGLKRTTAKIKGSYYFKNMFKKIKNYINKCMKCKINKIGNSTKENLIITETPNSAFDIIQIDTVGPLSVTNNNFKYILSMQCELTKYIILTPLHDKSALSVAKAMFNDIILKYGPPKSIKTDQGSEFLNELIKSICNLLKIEHKISTPYHHETLGVIERNHRELNIFLRNYLNLDHNDWDNWLQVYAFAYNTTPSYYHSYTPFELVFGKKSNLVENFMENNVTPIYNADDYSKIVKYHLETSLKRAKNIIQNEKLRRKKYYDKNHNNPITVKVGNKIFIKNQNRHKLDKFYNGPYEVIEILNNNNIKIKINNKEHIIHKNNVILR